MIEDRFENLERWEKIEWSEEFISGNEKIDHFHKKIIESVDELYDMLDDSVKYKDEIPVKTQEIEDAMFTHMDLEIHYLKTFELGNWLEHEKSHKYYKDNFHFYKDHSVPPIIRAVLTGELSTDYMRYHFYKYDIEAIQRINEKLKELEDKNKAA